MGRLTLLFGEEDGRDARRGAPEGALGCHDWAELGKTDRKMVESRLELADGVETA